MSSASASAIRRQPIPRSTPIVEEEEEEVEEEEDEEDQGQVDGVDSIGDVEFTELDPHHRKATLAFRGHLYSCPELVKAALAHDPPHHKSVLDLGSGTGVWAVEMALQHPDVQVLGIHGVPLGVDTAPEKVPPRRIPANCHFSEYDINLGLSQYYDKFDVVHMRNISHGLRNFVDSVQEAVKCLRPGGVFLVSEGDFELYHSDMVTLQEPRNDKFRNGSLAAKLLYQIRDAMIKEGSDILGAIASLEGGLWGYPGFDQDSIGAMSLFTPLGPWPESPNPHEQAMSNRIGSLQTKVWAEFINKHRLALVHTGMPGELIDQLLDQSVEEVANPGRYRLWARNRYCWGRRLLADGTPAQDASLDKTGYAPLPPSEDSEETPPPSRKNSVVATTSTDGCNLPRLYHTEHYYYTRDSVRVWRDSRWRERKRIGSKALPSSIPWERVVLQD